MIDIYGVTRNELPTNWGRWGERDELGTLNHITDHARARAAGIRRGAYAQHTQSRHYAHRCSGACAS